MVDGTYNLNGGFKPTMKRFADLDGPDFFPTPRWATFALIENEKFKGDIWECACGDGTMSQVLEETGCTVPSSDLFQRGYGEAGHDFLNPSRSADNIVTNPPYNCAEGFVVSGVKHAKQKFALLLRLAFLEGANRANTIFARTPPARVWVFSERITFYPKGVDPKGSGTTAYAWFVWDKDAPGLDRIEVVQARLQGAVFLSCPQATRNRYKPRVLMRSDITNLLFPNSFASPGC